MMTNQEAINILLNEQKCIDRNEGIQCDRECGSCDLVMDVGIIREAYNMAINALTAQPEQRWIPVSKRLPMEFEFVNCTCHSLIDDREDWVVETVYIPQPSDSPYSDWGNIPMLNSGDCEVVAWVHRDIPKPYKAESEDKE